MIKPITIRPFLGPESVDLYYNGEYVTTLTENEFLQFRLDLVKAAAMEKVDMNKDIESGYTLKCLIDTNDEIPRNDEIIIYCNGEMSNFPYAFGYVRRTLYEIFKITKPNTIKNEHYT